MELLPPRMRAVQVIGLLLMLAGGLLLLEMTFVEKYYGPAGPPVAIVVLSWVQLISSLLAIWGGKHLLSWGMCPSQPAAREQQTR